MPLGEQLRAARLAKDLSIADIAAKTNIPPATLRTLESGCHDGLPGTFFAISFARQYAEIVGLDSDLAGDLIRREMKGPEPLPEPKLHTIPRSWLAHVASRVRSGLAGAVGQHSALLGRLALAAVLMGGSLFWLSTIYGPLIRRDVQPTQVADSVPSAALPAVNEREPFAEATEVASTDQGTGPAVAPPTEHPTDGLNVEIVATELVWMRSVADDTSTRESILRPGESWDISADTRVEVHVGNAGGVVLRINGSDQGRLGESGQVRRVRITKDGWQVVSPPLNPGTL